MEIIIFLCFIVFVAALLVIPIMVFGVLLSAIYVSFKARKSMRN
jgi:hypothetical protein